MKLRTLSKPWMLLTIEPTEAGRASLRMDITCSIMSAERRVFVREAARSVR